MNTMKLAIPLLVALACSPSQGLAASILGNTLDDYAVLANTGVTCVTGPCNIFGDVGSVAVPATLVGNNFNFLSGGIENGPATTAQTELTAAVSAIGVVNTGSFTSLVPFVGNLDDFQFAQGGSIAPGTYDYAGVMLLNGILNLAGGTNLNPVWKFRSVGLTTGAASNVVVSGTNLANAGIYWSVTQATLDGMTFAGNVIASTAITSTTGVPMGISCGRLLAQTASVTLNTDTIRTDCLGAGFGSDGFDQAGVIPEPETYAMLLSGLGLMGWVARRRKQQAA